MPSACPLRPRTSAPPRFVEHDRDHWSRSLPPAIVGRSGVASSFWVHVTHGDPGRACGSGWRTGRSAPACGSWKTTGPLTISTADWSARPPSNCPPTCRWDITSCTFRSARPTSARRVDRLPRVTGPARQAGREPGMGPGHPAVQRAFEKILGHRRFDGSRRPGGVVGRAARRGFHSGQPAARGGAHRADGAVAVPADVAPVRQPAVPAGRGDPRVRLRPAPRRASARRGRRRRRVRRSPS